MVETGDSLFILADKEEAFNHRRIDYFQHSICSKGNVDTECEPSITFHVVCTYRVIHSS